MRTDSPSRWHRGAGVLTAVAVGASLVALPATAASAAEGPAPAPVEKTVVGAVHSDAISTFYEDGALVLDTKADTPERATRYDEDTVWFHLADEAKTTLPASPSPFDFLAPGGSDVWIAPMTQNPALIWPGFSTESVPTGTFDSDTTFRLVDVEGPGEVELYLNDAFGGVGERLWSSDEDSSASDSDLKAFSRASSRVHLHANWVFTATGFYDLTVEASAQKGGQTLSDTATYTFVVGDLPDDVDTTTSLSASATEAAPGDAVTLNASVEPAVDGYVEFLDGETVLGHEAAVDGEASFTTTALGLGSRSLTARYVPAIENLANTSTSAATTVTVAEEGQNEEFGVYGLADSYVAGDTIALRVGGYTLGEGQQYRWIVRNDATGTGGMTSAEITGVDRFTRDATTALDGAELSVQVRGTVGGRATTLQQTGWYPLAVTGENPGTGQGITTSQIGDHYYYGDPVEVRVHHADLAAGQSARWVTRYSTGGISWRVANQYQAPTGANPFVFDGGGFALSEYAYEIVAEDGSVVGRSPALSADVDRRELQIAGLQTVYRVGETLNVTSTLYPERDGVDYQWSIVDAGGWQPIDGATGPTLALPITAELDGASLALQATDASTATEEADGLFITSTSVEINVTDAAEGEQLLLLDSLAGHYHSNDAIKLNAKASPVASDTDTYRWWWQRPDQGEPVQIDGVTTATHEVVAEQALDGTTVWADLIDAQGAVLATSEPVTILVDDHGAAPRQKVSLTGIDDHYHSGDAVELTASVDPASVLTSFAWFVQKDGESAPSRVEGETDATLSFAASAEYDGAAIFAQLTYDDGTVYAESAPVTVVVDDHHEEPSPEPTDPVQPVLTVSGLAAHYHSGDEMTLTVSQEPDSGEDHWHWFVKAEGSDAWVVVAGQATSTLTRTVAAEEDGAQVIARLYDHDHAVIAESAPVTIVVDDHHEEPSPEPTDPGTTPSPEPTDPGTSPEPSPEPTDPGDAPGKPATAPVARTAADLGTTAAGGVTLSDTSPAAGQVVRIALGDEHAGEWVAAWMFSTPVLLGGDWTQADANGVITVRIPADAPAGDHRIAVFAADGALLGWSALSVSAAPASIGSTALAATGSDAPSVLWLWAPVLLIAVGVGVFLARRPRGTIED